MQLIRRYWRESLVYLQQHQWNQSLLNSMLDILRKTYISVAEDRVADSLRFHMIDIFWKELEQVGAKEVRLQKKYESGLDVCVITHCDIMGWISPLLSCSSQKSKSYNFSSLIASSCAKQKSEFSQVLSIGFHYPCTSSFNS